MLRFTVPCFVRQIQLLTLTSAQIEVGRAKVGLTGLTFKVTANTKTLFRSESATRKTTLPFNSSGILPLTLPSQLHDFQGN